jgi:trk system potassium uptake protein TrkH
MSSNQNNVYKIIKHYPARIMLLSLFTLIFLGTLLLLLPFARTETIPFINLFFLSTSILTVTGLNCVNIASFTTAGKFIILFLMQIGGLGLILNGILMIKMLMRLRFIKNPDFYKILLIDDFQEEKKIFFFVLKFILFIEIIGSILIFLMVHNNFNLFESIFFSIFHTVSYLFNIGLELFPEDMIPYKTNIIMQIIQSVLILAGSLGFITWYEILNQYKKSYKIELSEETKSELKTFAIIIATTSFLFFCIEYHNVLSDLSFTYKIFNSFFMGICSSNLGEFPFLITKLKTATVFLIMIIGFIGSTASSTGGGIKISSFTIFLAVIKTTLTEKPHTKINDTIITKDQIHKAISLISLAVAWIVLCIFLLLIVENHDFLYICIEAVSALSNTGIPTELSPQLSSLGKLLISATMIFGKILTFIFVVTTKVRIHDAQKDL